MTLMARADEAQRGRPRNPQVDQRIRRAAIQLYAECGWSGFNMDGVATRASVSKSSLYLRWMTKEALLNDIFRTELLFIEEVDTGSLREDLRVLARKISDVYAGDVGRAFLRAQVEAAYSPPDVFEPYQEFQHAQMQIARQIMRRGVERGELRPDVSVTMLLDALGGSILIHRLYTPEPILLEQQASYSYVDQLVDLLLGSACLHADVLSASS